MLGEHKSADKADKLEVRNLLTGLPVRERYLSKDWSVLRHELISDTNRNGFPEVAVLRTRPLSDSQAQNQFIIFDTSPGMPQVRLRGVEQFFAPLQMLNIGDINGNGTDDLAILGRQLNNPSQKAQVFDSGSTTARLSTVFFDRNFVAQDFDSCPDLNGNGSAELVVLGKRADNGRVRAIVKDARTGVLLGKVDFDFGAYR